MTTKIHKIGNSLGIYIPKAVAQQAGLKRGVVVRVSNSGQRIIVEQAKRRETLADLLAGVTPENTHPLIDWGPDVGKEIVEY